MADPREAVDFEGIAERLATFKHDGSIVYDNTKKGGSLQIDLAVKMVGNSQVGLSTDASMVMGKIVLVEKGGVCTVQFGGGTSLKRGTGATLTAGSKIVGALLVAAGGYVRNVAPATLAEVAVARHTVLDSSVAGDGADVKIMLDA